MVKEGGMQEKRPKPQKIASVACKRKGIQVNDPEGSLTTNQGGGRWV